MTDNTAATPKILVTESPEATPRLPLIARVLVTLTHSLDRLESLLTGRYLASYGISVTRILLGVTGIGLLLTNFASRHYTFGAGAAWNGELEAPISDFPNIWVFSFFHSVASSPLLLTISMIGLCGLAVLVTLGWRTRIVLPVYLVAWVSFIETNDSASDQGDNAYRMFLIAMLFADTTRRWSLDARRRNTRPSFPDADGGRFRWLLILAHNLSLLVLAFQVCAIYMSGGLYKAAGMPWQHGFAVYNPLQTQQFGTWPVLSDLLTTWGPLVVAISWGSVLFQCAFPFMLFNRKLRIIGLLGILSFHLGIGLLMGLPWFSLTMIAVDAIFVSDATYARLRAWVSHGREYLARAREASSVPVRTPPEPVKAEHMKRVSHEIS